MSRYMVVLVVAGVVPFVLSFFPPLRFYQNKKALIASIAYIVFLFGGWDIVAVWRGHWHFHPESVWRFRVVNLPIEEVLFFVVIPFCCIFTWEVVKYYKAKLP